MAHSGYNCYFPMPFARSARIEFETPLEAQHVFLQVDWHRYPGEEMAETKRFCARWRRENPTERYGEEFLVVDADGSGQLIGFVYGVRLFDNVDRWSHGGSDNIYIDGEGEHPAFLRGIGGEDTFGTSYGGCLHEPVTHHYASMPYYVHEDVGEARPAQRVVGCRFFEHDALLFRHSLHMRFGCMQNDICSTVYWYQEGAVRPFFAMPDWKQLLPGTELPRGTCDLALPRSGSWWLCGPFDNRQNQAMAAALPAETEFDPERTYDGMHAEGALWLSEGSRALGRDVARWVQREAVHSVVDFRHVFRPHARGVSPTQAGVALARCVLQAPEEMAASLRISWDDHLHLRVNDGEIQDLGFHAAFRSQTVETSLKKGSNVILLKLSNTIGSNHGGWAFGFKATGPDGSELRPEA